MRLNPSSRASISMLAATSGPVGTRAERSPSPIALAVSDKSRTGFANRRAASVAKRIVAASARSPTSVIAPVTCAMRVARVESGCSSVTSTAASTSVPPRSTISEPLSIGSRRSPAAASRPEESIVNVEPSRGVNFCCASSHVPNRKRTSARAMTVASPCSSGSCNKKRSRTSAFSVPDRVTTLPSDAAAIAMLRAALETAIRRTCRDANSCDWSSLLTRSMTRRPESVSATAKMPRKAAVSRARSPRGGRL